VLVEKWRTRSEERGLEDEELAWLRAGHAAARTRIWGHCVRCWSMQMRVHLCVSVRLGPVRGLSVLACDGACARCELSPILRRAGPACWRSGGGD
jgi:hypothetical protein